MFFFQNKHVFTNQKIKTGTFSKKQAIERAGKAAKINIPPSLSDCNADVEE